MNDLVSGTIHERYRQGRRAARWGVGVSLALGAAKLVGGCYGNSLALVSDAVHSLGDAVVFGVVLGALLWSEQPADREHPYGHMRIEAVAGFSVALLLILSGLGIIWEAIRSFSEPYRPVEAFTLWIAAVSAVVKEGLYRYSIRVARLTSSSSIQASAWDHRMDAFTSLAVLVALGLVKWGGADWHAADHVAALGVALVILLGGGKLLWSNVQELMDRQAGPDIVEAVRREAAAVPGVQGVEKLLVRKTGIEYLVDIHVEVDPEISVRAGHAIAHAVKDRIVRHLVPVRDVLVHIEPAPEREGKP
jgi:cation diffusion facilitator family transporter